MSRLAIYTLCSTGTRSGPSNDYSVFIAKNDQCNSEATSTESFKVNIPATFTDVQSCYLNSDNNSTILKIIAIFSLILLLF